jgi:hypothetical protein
LVYNQLGYLFTDPFFKGGQIILIPDADAHTIFRLLENDFQKGDLYRTIINSEPFLMVRRIAWIYFDMGPRTELSVKQVNGDVSLHLVYYHYKREPLQYSDEYIKIVKRVFDSLHREIPREILVQLDFERYVKRENGSIIGLFIVLLLCIFIVDFIMILRGSIIGPVISIIPVGLILYYLYKLRTEKLNIDLMHVAPYSVPYIFPTNCQITETINLQNRDIEETYSKSLEYFKSIEEFEVAEYIHAIIKVKKIVPNDVIEVLYKKSKNVVQGLARGVGGYIRVYFFSDGSTKYVKIFACTDRVHIEDIEVRLWRKVLHDYLTHMNLGVDYEGYSLVYSKDDEEAIQVYRGNH